MPKLSERTHRRANPPDMRFVLDASAALALLHDEPGAGHVGARLHDAGISAVNLIEVGSKLVDGGVDLENARRAVALLRVETVDFDLGLAETAIALRARTRPFGLSLADRACLALAIRENATALTADRAWAKLDVGCRIELIR